MPVGVALWAAIQPSWMLSGSPWHREEHEDLVVLVEVDEEKAQMRRDITAESLTAETNLKLKQA